MFARTTLSLLLLCGVVVAAGCDGCAEDPAGSNDPNKLPPNGNGDGTNNGDDDENKTPEGRDLVFNGTSPVDVFYGQQQQLAFTLTTRSGVKVSGQNVRFSLQGEGGTLNVQEAATDANGVARVTFTAGNADATVTVRASADNANDVAVTVNVKVNPVGSLRVAVTSQTRIPVTRAELLVYRGPAQNVPSCDYLDTATTLPTATFTAELPAVPGNRTFTDQPHGQSVTVLASGYNANGDLIGVGCTDGSGIIGGQTTTLSVAIQQLPSVLEGDYDVLLKIDLGQALPEPYESWVETVTGILSDPAGYAVYQAMRYSDLNSGFTTFVTVNDGAGGTRIATWREVSDNPGTFNMWNSASNYVDTMLANQFGSNYTTVTTVGGDIRQAITAFEVGSGFSLSSTASAGIYRVDERWNDLVFTWRLSCAAGDLGCARRPVQLDDTNYAPVTTTYNALATRAPDENATERFEVVSDPHVFSLRYGAIIMIALNEVIFPSLPGGLASDSLAGVLHNLIDCASVGQAIAGAIGIGDASMYEGFCGFGLDYAATTIENRVLELEVGGNPELGPKEQTGALGGGVFYLVDADHDLATELVRDLEMQIQWNDAEEGSNEDILAPIEGEGRLAADGCDADAACQAGLFCQPIPHYLKVKKAEQTCLKPVGDALGEEPCNADNECASGICVGDSPGVAGTCFSACVSDTACGLGTCMDAAAFLPLDSVLQGLGEASLSSCMLP